MKEKNNKSVTLRAFSIRCSKLSSNKSDYIEKLKEKLENTVVNDRRMRLSQQDPKKEEDLISYYNTNNEKNILFGTMLRITPGGDVAHITNELFKNKSFTIDELVNTKHDNYAAVYRGHYYFCMDDKHLITNLPTNKTITRLQTYVNFLLSSEDFELTPIIISSPENKLSDLKRITVKNPFTDTLKKNRTENKSIRIDKNLFEIVKGLFKDTQNLDDVDLSQIISAELILKLTKPRRMSEEEYQRLYGAYLKPISDIDNISFKDKNGKQIKGKDVLKTKNVDIEITETGELVEPQLNQEMIKFLNELKEWNI